MKQTLPLQRNAAGRQRAADEQPQFVILNEVKDPSGYYGLAMR
jgi:hypothetical protein